MTTVTKQRGTLGSRIGEVLVDWLYPLLEKQFEKKRAVVEEAKAWQSSLWDGKVCCVKCHGVNQVYAQFCIHCRTWLDEQETRRTASLAGTDNLYTIKINQTQYPVHLRGRRMFDVWMQDVRPLVNDEDRWVR